MAKTKVLFAAYESLPFVKTGGLADVIYALPKNINKDKYEVKVVLPLFKIIYDKYCDQLNYVDHILVSSGCIKKEADIYSYINEGIEYYFIKEDDLFNRDGIYGYEDDVLRYSFFNLAIVEMLIKLKYYPHIIHSHDYHTALIPAICKYRYSDNPKIKKIKHVYTIHNLGYQGEYSKGVLFDYLDFDYKYYEDGTLRFNDSCNFMKIGIVTADAITTVSKTYAEEIKTSDYGCGLDTILKYREKCLFGINNGIDENLFNPATDHIYKKYNVNNYLKGKAANKEALQKILGLKVDKDALLVGIVSRLTYHKGMDLIISKYPEMMKKHVQFVVLGAGESKYEYTFRMMCDKYKGRVAYICGKHEDLARDIYAGSDMLLMPSLYEPCGLSQLIAMRYGTLPLVRETGGLKDSVEPYNCYTKSGNGFSFTYYNANDMMHVFNYAYDQFNNNKADWKMLIRNAMKKDVSFKTSAKEYEALYDRVLKW